MNGDAMQLLVAGLVHNHSVTSLDLSKNPLGDTGAQHLGELLSIENKHDQVPASRTLALRLNARAIARFRN